MLFPTATVVVRMGKLRLPMIVQIANGESQRRCQRAYGWRKSYQHLAARKPRLQHPKVVALHTHHHHTKSARYGARQYAVMRLTVMRAAYPADKCATTTIISACHVHCGDLLCIVG